jgi:hypothetical protein
VDLVISTFIDKDTRTMNFRRALKICQRLGLAVTTTATIAIGIPTPSQAAIFPSIIVTTDGRPPLALFGESRESYTIGCPELDKLWTGTPRRAEDAAGYDRAIRDSTIRFAANLPCNGGAYEGYISPSSLGGNILIVTHQDGRKYQHAATSEFLRVLRVTPRSIPLFQGKSFLRQFPVAQTNFEPGSNPPIGSCKTCGIPTTAPVKPVVSFVAPNRILTVANNPPLAVFDTTKESYVLGSDCTLIDGLWSRIPRQPVTIEEYRKLMPSTVASGLTCTFVPPGFYQGFSSPDLPGGHLLVIQHLDGTHYRHYINDPAFFSAIGITPKQLSAAEVAATLKQFPAGRTNFTTSK